MAFVCLPHCPRGPTDDLQDLFIHRPLNNLSVWMCHLRFQRPDIVEPHRHLEVLKTIERLGGSASYERHITKSKSSDSSALTIPSFPNHDPVYAQIKIIRLIGSTQGFAEVRLYSGLEGEYTVLLQFWVDVAPAESTAGGMFGYLDWDFLLAHEVNFAIEGLEHFDGASITFSHEMGIIGKIDLIGSWSLAAVKEAHGTCQWTWVFLAVV